MRISRLIFSGATIGTIIGTGRVAAGMSGSSLVIVPGMGTTLANEAGPCKNAPAPPSPARPQAVRSWTPPGEAGSGGPPVEGRAERRGGGTLPLPRDAQQMVYDPATRSVLVFGGKGTRDRYFNDLWSYHAGGGWSRLSPRGCCRQRDSAREWPTTRRVTRSSSSAACCEPAPS